MARPKKSEALDLKQRINLTVGVIDRLICRKDIKCQAFLRGSKVPALRVRVNMNAWKGGRWAQMRELIKEVNALVRESRTLVSDAAKSGWTV